MAPPRRSLFFFFNDTATTEIYTLSLHDALPIYQRHAAIERAADAGHGVEHIAQLVHVGHGQLGHGGLVAHHLGKARRSEEHTSELQSPCNLVCRLLLEKKKVDLLPTIVARTHKL